jgi:cytochrome c peroxidase
LRNIARTPPYGHNGYFENLPYLLDFLNSRDIGSQAVGR